MTVRIHSLDGLRGLAAYIVVLGHFQLYTTNFGEELLPKGTGQVGVMIFFVLSGFLMGSLYMGRSFNKTNLTDFYQKRIARVVPLYILVVVFCFLINTRFPVLKVFDISHENILEHLLFWRGEHVLWTIAVEVQFYLLFPIFWYAHSRLNGSTFLYMLLGIALLVLLKYPEVPPVLRYLHVFIIGLLASLVGRKVKGFGSSIFVFSLLFLFLALPGPRDMLLGNKGTLWRDPALMIIIPVVLIASLHSVASNKILGNKFMTFLGKISYSVYLLHMLVLWGLKSVGVVSGTWLGLSSFLVAVTVVSWLSYKYIETPFRRVISTLHITNVAVKTP